MQSISISRAVYDRGSSVGTSKVTGYRLTPLDAHRVHKLQVNSIQQYYGGCYLHKKCDGHVCITPRGRLILPHKFTALIGPIENPYGKPARALLDHDGAEPYKKYLDEIRKTMMSKSGVIRGEMMGTSVDGSIRLVITPCWDISKNEVCLPRHVAAKVVYPYIPTTVVDGVTVECAQYATKCINDGDHVLVVRAPSLQYHNTQPMRVVIWDEPCIGLSPANCDEYHADFDGDEMQVYPLGSVGAIAEAKAWIQTVGTWPFKDAAYEYVPLDEYGHDRNMVHREFMQHTTVSMRQIKAGVQGNPLMKMSRMKDDTTAMTRQMMTSPMSISAFYDESIRGISDIMAQQLTQGTVGQLSRHARIGASCFTGVEHGTVSVSSNRGQRPLVTGIDIPNTFGNPIIRAISAFAAKAQQSALDSHRAKVGNIKRFDVVRCLLGDTDDVLVIMSSTLYITTKWHMACDGGYVCICAGDAYIHMPDVIGCTNVKVLAGIDDPALQRQVCLRGLVFVGAYLDVTLTNQELITLTEALCFECDKAVRPVFSQRGMYDRDLKWLCKMVNTHYGKLTDLVTSGLTVNTCAPTTVTECRAFCNFDNMHKARVIAQVGFCVPRLLTVTQQSMVKIALMDMLARNPHMRAHIHDNAQCAQLGITSSWATGTPPSLVTCNAVIPVCRRHGEHNTMVCGPLFVYQYLRLHNVYAVPYHTTELVTMATNTDVIHVFGMSPAPGFKVVRHELI